MKCIYVAGFIALYVIGFSLGDELGLAESLGNVEGNKRRSLNLKTGTNTLGLGGQAKSLQTVVTPIQTSRPMALTVRPVSNSQPKVISARPKITASPTKVNIQSSNNYRKTGTNGKSPAATIPPFRPVPPKKEQMTFDAAKNSFRRPDNNGIEIQKSQSFEIFPNNNANLVRPLRMQPVTVKPVKSSPMSQPLYQTQTENTMSVVNNFDYKQNSIPAFQAMPTSISRIDGMQNQASPNRSPQPVGVFQPDPMPIPPSNKLPVVDLMGHTVEELAAVANVSVDTIRAAIVMRQQEMLAAQQAAAYHKLMMAPPTTISTTIPTTTSTTTTTTTTTPRPFANSPIGGGNKVMNAPKEYYPVGYEKNFDDNFTSKVDLPTTAFYCGDQKHFPGLYADEDLGCMVFHVCALTDDGLIMKSFLCPESTLFDQTVLKCNWWFYVDCKNSKSLYDSNIPVSKSYQLMKALTFFSNYKNSQNDEDGVDVEALKNSVNGNKTT